MVLWSGSCSACCAVALLVVTSCNIRLDIYNSFLSSSTLFDVCRRCFIESKILLPEFLEQSHLESRCLAARCVVSPVEANNPDIRIDRREFHEAYSVHCS